MCPVEPVITHLFTDLEGSSRLWDTEPARMAEALARHDTLARQTVDGAGGRWVKTTGDGMHAVFEDPSSAVIAAINFETGVAVLAREFGLPLRARCGLHSGTAHARDSDYFGSTVNRAARIMGAAHGGQVLLSQAVALHVRDHMPAGATLRELGRVRLRDMSTPETLFQLVHAELASTFPALRSLDVTPNNLPLQTTSFVGRRGALTELLARLARQRLITVTGPGGIGKTRLALQLAAESLDQFPDGAWFVDLAATRDPVLVPALVAQTVSVTGETNRSLAETVASFLAQRRALLLLDNCEHVIEAAATFAELLLHHAIDVRVVATSREPLRVAGEALYPVPPLALPDEHELPDTANLARYPAITLFVDRVRAHVPSFRLTDRNVDAVFRICRRLDGIPLAVELAAARLRTLGLDEVEQRVADRFRLLTGGARTASPRQQTLAATVQWSYDLLTDPERLLFDRLSVFAGSFDLEAAEQVAGQPPLATLDVVDLLTALVDKSLVTVASLSDEGASSRYRLLETLRAFASDRLDARAGEAARARAEHARYYAALAGSAERSRPDGSVFRERLKLDHDNLRAALAWAASVPELHETGIAGALGAAEFWRLNRRHREAREWFARMLALQAAAPGSEARKSLLMESASAAFYLGDFMRGRDDARAALAECEAGGDTASIAKASLLLAMILGEQGELAQACAMYERALDFFVEQGDRVYEARTLINLANTRYVGGDLDDALSCSKRALAIGRSLADERIEANAEQNLANFSLERGELSTARRHYEAALRLATNLGDRQLELAATGGTSQVLLAQGELASAAAMNGRLLEASVEDDTRQNLVIVVEDLAQICSLRGAPATAARLFAAAKKLRSAVGFVLSPTERVRLDERTAVVRAALDESEFDAVWSEGAGWSFDQLVNAARDAQQQASRAAASAPV